MRCFMSSVLCGREELLFVTFNLQDKQIKKHVFSKQKYKPFLELTKPKAQRCHRLQ